MSKSIYETMHDPDQLPLIDRALSRQIPQAHFFIHASVDAFTHWLERYTEEAVRHPFPTTERKWIYVNRARPKPDPDKHLWEMAVHLLYTREDGQHDYNWDMTDHNVQIELIPLKRENTPTQQIARTEVTIHWPVFPPIEYYFELLNAICHPERWPEAADSIYGTMRRTINSLNAEFNEWQQVKPDFHPPTLGTRPWSTIEANLRAIMNQVIEKHPSALPLWERVPDVGYDRKMLELLHAGFSDAEIAQKIGRAARTIGNRISLLRGIYDKKIVPYRKMPKRE